MILYIGIDYQNHPDLKTDALAATLLIPPAFQAVVIQQLDPTLLQLPAHELTSQIVQRVLAIADPVIRSRALWRLSHYAYDWQNVDFRALAIAAAEQIADPLRRSCAFERLIPSVPVRQRELMKDKALEAAGNISDPNNQARAFVRLALYENSSNRWSLYSYALLAVRKI
jgi:hypothetical protein